MNKPTRNKQPLFNIANNALVDLPAPSILQLKRIYLNNNLTLLVVLWNGYQ
jgi:hypothetical protein